VVISIFGFIQEELNCKLDGVRCFFVLYNGYFYTTIHNCLEITVMLFISQDCREFHQAKDGDGWVEQSFQPILFGMLHKVNARLFQPLTSVILHLSFQGKQMICSILSLF
jgi:hypothetical protein